MSGVPANRKNGSPPKEPTVAAAAATTTAAAGAAPVQSRSTLSSSSPPPAGALSPSGQQQQQQHIALASSTVAALGLSSPLYRGPLNHGSTAELQEGFRILTNGVKAALASHEDIYKALTSVGMHLSEDELKELTRVVHQDERTSGIEFAEFMLLMTKEVDEQMIEDMRSAFAAFDKDHTGVISKKQFTQIFVTMGERSSAEELEELLALADMTEESETVDYNAFVTELALRLNTM